MDNTCLIQLSEGESGFIKSAIHNGIRLDGRLNNQYREISIDLNPIPQACGSVRVKSGSSVEVVVAVKADITVPSFDKPDSGDVCISIDDSSNALDDNRYDYEILISQLHSLLSGCVSEEFKKQLCIVPGKFAWRLTADCLIFCSDGGLFATDMLSLGLICALKECTLPTVRFESSGDATSQLLLDQEKVCRFEVSSIPQLVSLAVFEQNSSVDSLFIVDPTQKEEICADALVVVGTSSSAGIVSVRTISGLLTPAVLGGAIVFCNEIAAGLSLFSTGK